MNKRMSEKSFVHTADNTTESGFTLVELLISLTLFLIVTGAIYGLLQIARLDRNTSMQRVETMQTVRSALNTVGHDALNTGYKYRTLGSFFPDNIHNTVFGLTADTNTTPDRMMQVLSGNNVNTNVYQASSYKTDQITFIYGDETFNSGRTLSVNWMDCDGEQLVVNWPTPAPSPALALPTNNDLVIITGQNSSAIGMVTSTATGAPAAGTYVGCTAPPTVNVRTIKFASGDLLDINKTGAANIIRNVTAPATLSRVKLSTYRVLNDGTLVRTEYGNFPTTGKQDMPLAYNVEDMIIQYVLEDGTLLDDPAAGPDGVLGNTDDTPTRMQEVRQVRITIVTRSTEKDKRTGLPVKITLTSTFNTRNMGYDAQ